MLVFRRRCKATDISKIIVEFGKGVLHIVHRASTWMGMSTERARFAEVSVTSGRGIEELMKNSIHARIASNAWQPVRGR